MLQVGPQAHHPGKEWESAGKGFNAGRRKRQWDLQQTPDCIPSHMPPDSQSRTGSHPATMRETRDLAKQSRGNLHPPGSRRKGYCLSTSAVFQQVRDSVHFRGCTNRDPGCHRPPSLVMSGCNGFPATSSLGTESQRQLHKEVFCMQHRPQPKHRPQL